MTKSSSKNNSRLELGILDNSKFSVFSIDQALKSIDSDISIDIVSDENHQLTRVVADNSSSLVSRFMHQLDSIDIRVCILKNLNSKYPKGGVAQVVDNPWQILPVEARKLLSSGLYLVPFQYWLKHSDSKEIQAKYLAGELGVWFTSDADLTTHRDVILAAMKFWATIAIDFPIFRDGRGFSHAAILRERLGWQGELRAIGDALIDQLLQMSKVAFDSLLLRADQDESVALAQFEIIHHLFQNDWRASRDQLSGQSHVS